MKSHEAEELPSFLLGHFPVQLFYPSTKGHPKKKSGTKTKHK